MAIEQGDGWAVAHLEDLGDGPGFRKVRGQLGVEAFGVNAIVLPAGHTTGWHFHDEQEELYVCLAGVVEIEIGGEGGRHVLRPGGMARVAAPVHRRLHNPEGTESTYLCVGGKGGYVGRDGRMVE